MATLDARTTPLDEVVEAAARVVLSGGLLIFPTDTVYGIGCDPNDVEAVDRIYGAKNRPGAKPLTLHVGSVAEFLEYAGSNTLAAVAARRLMPGPVTLIVQRPAWISAGLTSGLPSLGFRVPDDPISLAILDRCGPLAATSANRSGEQAYLGIGGSERLPPYDVLIENGPTRYRMESTVIDCTGAQARVLREGVYSLADVEARIGPVSRYPVKDRA